MSITNTGVQEFSKLWCREVSKSDQQQCPENTVVDDFIYKYIHMDQNTGKIHIELRRAHQCRICYCVFLPSLFSVVQGTIAAGDEHVQRTIILFPELNVGFN